jgi:hypothetical protein
VADQLAKIDLVCVDERHLKIGREVADGDGHLTVSEGKWAYCSAAREDEPHTWHPAGGLEFAQIRHADLERPSKD